MTKAFCSTLKSYYSINLTVTKRTPTPEHHWSEEHVRSIVLESFTVDALEKALELAEAIALMIRGFIRFKKGA